MIIGLDEYRGKYDFSNVRGIIHVGAHEGQEYDDYNEYFYKDIPIHWFEPQKDIYELLKKNLLDKTNNYFYNFALGSKNHELPIWKENANGGQSASFSKPEKHLEVYPHISFEMSDNLEIRTLDSLNIIGPNVLVIDVQGLELEVLKGADFTLDKIDHVFCEINSDKLYEDSPTVGEINSLLSTKGFILLEDWWTSGSWGDGYWSRI